MRADRAAPDDADDDAWRLGFPREPSREVASSLRESDARLERRWRALKPSCVAKASGPLRLSLEALDSEARELVDFRAWNLVACGKICKKRRSLIHISEPTSPRRSA